MIPTVTQQLTGIRAAMAKVILPAVDPDDSFAQEQAGLVLATLDWLLDVHESEYVYVATELAEHHDLVTSLARLSLSSHDAELATEIDAALEKPAACGGLLPLALVEERGRLLKGLADRAFRAIAAHGSADDALRARELVSRVARNQRDRELAWFRMTGFTTADGDIASVLASSS
jgi:hypothetical protein